MSLTRRELFSRTVGAAAVAGLGVKIAKGREYICTKVDHEAKAVEFKSVTDCHMVCIGGPLHMQVDRWVFDHPLPPNISFYNADGWHVYNHVQVTTQQGGKIEVYLHADSGCNEISYYLNLGPCTYRALGSGVVADWKVIHRTRST